MWRSRASAFLLRSSTLGRLPRQVKAPLTTLNPPPVPLPNSSRWSPPPGFHLRQCYRFFSVDPAAGGAGEAGEAASSETPNPDSISAETVLWSTGFREESEKGDAFGENGTPGFVSEESESWGAVFQGGTDKGDVFAENQEPVFPADGEPWSGFGAGEEGRIVGDGSDSVRKEIGGGGDDPRAGFAPEESAEEAAEEVPEIDAEKRESVLSFLQSTVGEPLESALDKMDLPLSQEFVARVLQTPLILPDKLIGFFTWASKKAGFVMSSSVLDLLVRAISGSAVCSKHDVYMLWDLIRQIGEGRKELLTTEIMNHLIFMFSKLEKSRAGLEVFDRVEEFGCRPNADTYYLTIEALSKRSMHRRAWTVCEKMLAAGELPDGEKIGKVIAFFCKIRRAKDAHSIYLIAKVNGKCPAHPCVDLLVARLSRKDDTVRTALELLDEYSEESRKYAIKPFTSVIAGLCRAKDAVEAKKLLHRMMDSGPPPGNAVFNHVIGSLSKAGEMDDAIALMKQMENRGLRPDIYTYNVIMSGFTKGGLMDEARKIFKEAKKRYPKLISATYHILIRGYCKIEEFETALECMREMKNDGIQPNTDEYNKLVQSLCLKALDWHTAEKLLEEMKESGLHLKGITRSLIAAVKELEEEALKNVVAIKT